MKTKFLRLTFISVILLSLFACKKQRPLDAGASKIVILAINASTTEDLEFVYKNSVIGSVTAAQGKVALNFHLIIDEQDNAVTVRKTGTSTVVNTTTIRSAPYSQLMNVYYDGTKVYTNAIDLRIKGYVMSGELEFLLDGNIIAGGTGVIDKTINFGIDKDGVREIQVRQKGETAILITKKINASPVQQTLGFLFDGISVVDNIKLDPPVNAANMSITGRFSTSFVPSPDVSVVTAKLKDVDIDLVFYIKNNAGVIRIPNPSIRVTMPKSGAFVTFELPPLPDDQSYYTYDICEAGTDVLPYTDIAGAATFIPKLSKGLYGQLQFDGANFKAGTSRLLLMKDATKLVTSPASAKGRYFYGVITDLSQYFQ